MPRPPHVSPTSSLTFRGLGHGRAQAVHVITSVTVVTEQQLVLGGETRPAGTLGARAPETGWGAGAGVGSRGALLRKLALQHELWSPLATHEVGFCNYRTLSDAQWARY